MTDEDYSITTERAMSLLVVQEDYDAGDGPEPCVHTYRNAAGMLIGAHHSVTSLRMLFDHYGAQEAGSAATDMGHGIVVIDDHGPLFVEAQRDAP